MQKGGKEWEEENERRKRETKMEREKNGDEGERMKDEREGYAEGKKGRKERI